MRIFKNITIDLGAEVIAHPIIAKQYDKDSRFLTVRLTYEGEQMNVTPDKMVAFNALREDGASNSFAGSVNDDGTVTVPITQWMLELDGIVRCDISIISPDERKLTSASFSIKVDAATHSGEPSVDDDDYDLFVTLIAECAATKREVEELRKEVANIQISGATDAVSIDQGTDKAGTLLYVGADGKVTDVLVGDGVEITYGAAKNIVHGEWCNGRFTNGAFVAISTGKNYCTIDDKFPVTSGETYTASVAAFGGVSSASVYVHEYDADGNFIQENLQAKGTLTQKTPRTFIVGENTAYISFFLYSSGAAWENIVPQGMMIEQGTVATEYEPYRVGYTMAIQKQTAEKITDTAYIEHAPSASVRSIAHRGCPEGAPECTAPSYILARKKGFTVAENDVYCTSDGKYVMWHDDTLSHCSPVYSLDGKTLMADANGNRYWISAGKVYTYDEVAKTYTEVSVDAATLSTVDGKNLAIAEQTFGFLRNIDVGKWKNGIFAGTQMLSFEEWIVLCKELGMECYIDAKFTYTDEQAAELVAIVRKKGMLRKCSWLGALETVRKADPKARCGLLWQPTESNLADGGVYAKALADGGEGSVFWNPRNTDVTVENAELVLSRGYGYECWYVITSNVPTETYYAEIERLLHCGCQGLTLDDHTVEDFMVYKYGEKMGAVSDGTVDAELEEVSAALDELHNYAQDLIGGEA